MRLRKQEGQWIAHFSQLWEITTLTDAGNIWVPFALSQEYHSIGEIHAQSHVIRFFDQEPSMTTLVVSLLPTPSPDLG